MLKRSISFYIMVIFLLTCCFQAGFITPVTKAEAAGTSYYVSSSSGNDSNNGTSSSTPWQTFAKVSSMIFQPGDTIYLKAGDIWNEMLTLNGESTSANFITLTSYGTGPRPKIKLNYESLSWCIKLINTAGWKITNLEMCNAEQGIMFQLRPGIVNKDGLWIENCYFHDIRLPAQNGYVLDDVTMQWGAGIYLYMYGDPGIKMKNVTIKNCFSDYCDGFLDMHINGSDIAVDTFLLEGCTAMHSAFNTLSLMHFNTQEGHGATFRNSVFSYNGGTRSQPTGGTDVMAGSADNTVFDNCEFNNRTRYGTNPDGCGIDYEWGNQNLSVINSFFYNNDAAGVYFFGKAGPNSGINVSNCLFYRNNRNSSYGSASGEIHANYTPAGGSISNNVAYPRTGHTFYSGPTGSLTFTGNVNPGTKPIVATPVVSVPAGTYNTPQTVSLSCATAGAEIRYTTDGSIPTAVSALYTGPINVSSTMCLNAKAFLTGYENSETKASIYSISDGAYENLAKNKTATASSYNSQLETAACAVDSLLTTHWCATSAAPQWLTVDLGGTYNIKRWVVKHAEAAGETALYNTRDYKLQVSTNGTTFTDVDTVTGNTAAITDRIITGTDARYVRLYVTTPTQPGTADKATRIRELEIYNTGVIPQYAKRWEFNTAGNAEGWTAYSQISNASVSGGFYGGTGTGTDPYMRSATGLGVDITNNKKITILLKNSTSSTEGKFYFITNADGTWNEAKAKSFTIVAQDTVYTAYTIDMTSVAGWTGVLKQLRFDPATAAGNFSIDYIRIEN